MARPLSQVTVTPSFRGGEGSPLVLVHGATATWRVWSKVIPYLTPHHDVLAPTLPGHHGGPPLVPPPHIGTFADGVERAMDRAGFEHAHLAGNSLGGWTAVELARRGRALSVVALSPAGGWVPPDHKLARFFSGSDHQLRLIRPVLPVAMRSALLRRLAFRRIAEHSDQLSRDEILAAIDGILGCAVEDMLPLVETCVEESADPGVPVLIAWGERDRLLPEKGYAGAWRRAAPYATWRVLPGVGHVPMIDDPAAVARTILGWIGGATGDPDSRQTDPS